MRLKYALGFVVLIAATAGLLEAKEPKPAGTIAPAKACKASVNSEEPMSIFNDELRRFKFRLEHEKVSKETAMVMTEVYLKKDEYPGIIGVYPDYLTNSLVFIASPESESAIRKALATRIINLWGIPNDIPTPLETQMVFLQKRRKEQLAELASLECELVQYDDGKHPEVVERIQLLMQEPEKELKSIKKQMDVVEKYLKIQNDNSK